MRKKTKKAWIKALAGLTINISAAWFAVTFITPNFVGLSDSKNIVLLFADLFFGIIFLTLTAVLERINQ